MTVDVYISYAWKDKDQASSESREQIVDEVCQALGLAGFNVLRDRTHLDYKANIKTFMKRIGEGNYIVAVVSDKYLKSEYCMYEASEMLSSEYFVDRIFPIILNDANIFDRGVQVDYLLYWGEVLQSLENQQNKMKHLPITMHFKLGERYRDIRFIAESVQDFLVTLSDMNVLTEEMHRQSGFDQLIKSIKAKVGRDKKQLDNQIPEQVVITTESGQVFIKRDDETGNNNQPIITYISYAWGGETEAFVNEMIRGLSDSRLAIVRDKRDLGYKGSTSNFMRQMDRVAIVVVIDDKFLKSLSCMFELTEIASNEDFRKRVFPVVMSDADIYKPVNRIKYVQLWEQEIKSLDEAMKTVSSANLQGFREEIDSYQTIRNTLSELVFILKDMNTLTPDIHQDDPEKVSKLIIEGLEL